MIEILLVVMNLSDGLAHSTFAEVTEITISTLEGGVSLRCWGKHGS